MTKDAGQKRRKFSAEYKGEMTAADASWFW